MASEILEKKNDLLDVDSVRIIDILAQIKSLNEIISLHQEENDDNFMVNQYQDMKHRFLEELKDLLFIYEVEVLVNTGNIEEADEDENPLAG